MVEFLFLATSYKLNTLTHTDTRELDTKTATCMARPRRGFASLRIARDSLHIMQEKKAVVEQIVKSMTALGQIPVFDSAGKYGAGLALEELGLCLEVSVPRLASTLHSARAAGEQKGSQQRAMYHLVSLCLSSPIAD